MYDSLHHWDGARLCRLAPKGAGLIDHWGSTPCPPRPHQTPGDTHPRDKLVVDGALIEGSTGLANPSFTIAALAERCMDRILRDGHTEGGDDRRATIEAGWREDPYAKASGARRSSCHCPASCP